MGRIGMIVDGPIWKWCGEGTVVAQEIQGPYGKIAIEEGVIATISGVAATECYGLVGMAPRNIQEGLSDLLRRENYERGVDIQFNEDSISIQLYIVVEYGVKISEVARNVQERVKYAVESLLGLKVDRINVKVQGASYSPKEKVIGGTTLDVINGFAFKSMLLAAARHLDQQKDKINVERLPGARWRHGNKYVLTLSAATKELEQFGNGKSGG